MFSNQDKVKLRKLLSTCFRAEQVNHVLDKINESQSNINETTIPQDVQISTFLYLPIEDVKQLGMVSSHFNHILKLETFWKQHFHIHFDFTLDFILEHTNQTLQTIQWQSEFIHQFEIHSLQLKILRKFKLVSSLVSILIKCVDLVVDEAIKFRRIPPRSLLDTRDNRQFELYYSKLDVPRCDPYTLYTIHMYNIDYYNHKLVALIANSLGFLKVQKIRDMLKSPVGISLLLYTPIPHLSQIRVINPVKDGVEWLLVGTRLTRLETKESNEFTIAKKHVTIYDLLIACMSVKNFKDDSHQERVLGLSKPFLDENGILCIRLVF